MKRTGESIVLALAATLGKRVESEVVTEALKLICETYLFDAGLVYEVNQDNQYSLKEYVASGEIALCQSFSADVFLPEYRRKLAEELIVFGGERLEGGAGEQQLLLMLRASSFVLTANMDDKNHIFGCAIFFNVKRAQPLLEEQRKELEVLLSMFSRYIGMRMYQSSLTFAQKSLESILDNTGIDIYVNDFGTHDILYVNKSMAAPYGGKEEFMGRKCWEVLFPGQNGPCEFCPQKKLTDETGNPTKVYTWDYQRAFDGSWFRVFSAAFRWVDGRMAHVVSSADITDNKKNEKLIEYMANYDSLTGLPNRRRLVADCENRINRAKVGEMGYVLFFDIDGFKQINDSLGHDAGDEFLVKLGEFFTEIPLLKDGIYRNGGDEFVAIIGGITKANIINLTSFLHKRFEYPWELKKGSVVCNISVGVACYPEDGESAEVLISKADQAMYQVKKDGGGNFAFYHKHKREE